MGKMMNKFLDIMRLNDGYDEDDYYDDDYEDNDTPSRASSQKQTSYLDEDLDKEASKHAKVKPVKSNKIIPMRSNGKGMEVCVIKPSTVEDAREISDTLLSGRAVVLNLEGLQVNVAQRIIDFTSGSCYSINGNLQKVSGYIFIITPEAVDISGDFQDLFSGSNFDVAAFQS